MLENTNRAIAFNSLILYAKMAITTICSLLTTRFALQALGVVDFGLYAVLGGIISLISIFNTIMYSTSNRFIAVAIGKGNLNEANKQFNVNLTVHIGIAILALLIAYPIGSWYIPRYVNYDGPLSNEMMVYCISVLGCILSFIGVPFSGLLMAKEKFIVFSLAEVFVHVVKLLVAWLLVDHFGHKLFIYTVTMAIMTGATTLIYVLYCKRHFQEIVRLKIVKDRTMYKNVFGFSAWVGIGAVAYVGRDQGAVLVVNTFFNTAMNTAMGVASSINTYVSMFAQNITQPMAPQITKNYASGNMQRVDELLVMSTKYSFLFMFLLGSIFLIEPEWLLGLWLTEVPQFATIFLVLFIVNNLVQALNSGISNLIFASGNIALYQMLVSLTNILSIVAGFFVLRGGAKAYYLLVAYIIVSIIRFFVIQWVLHKTLNYDTKKLWTKSYLPSILVVLLFTPAFFLMDTVPPVIRLFISFSYLCVLIWFFGLNRTERNRISEIVTRRHKSSSR